MASDFEDLQDLYALEGSVEIGRHRFTVRHLGVKHFALFSKAFHVAWAALGGDGDEEMYVAEHADDLLPAVSAATDVPLDVLRKLRGDVQLRLFAATLEVNRDFFLQCARLKYGETAAIVIGMVQEVAAAGGQPSTTSPPEDTPTAPRIPLAALRASSARPS